MINWQQRLQQFQKHTLSYKKTTYDHIIQAFKQLVMMHDVDKLTVAQISEAANISRKTFYAYFQDKNDVMEHIIYIDIIEPMEKMRALSQSFQMPSLTIMSWLYEQFYHERDFYRRINSFIGQNSFTDFMLSYTTSIVAHKFSELVISDAEKEYSVYFYAASHTMVLSKWINDGMKVPPSDMASFYENWTIPAIVTYVKRNT
ncbi:MAG: TetR/AcrR family transcriptional regulator C-terminal domain-containing protein [Caryophanon sp.]|nr:TetR/AcrR family transcriptional regulator C-terminal domain-containing protein [Caryophanon sp.]